MTPETLKKAVKISEKIRSLKGKIAEIKTVSESGGCLAMYHTSRGIRAFELPESMEHSVINQCLLRMEYDLEQLEKEFQSL